MTNSIIDTTVISTNLNMVVIDLLTGAKKVGGEIYAASKEGIASAVAFAQEQAPMVVSEFLTWQFMDALINCIGFVLVSVVLLKIARWGYKKYQTSDSHCGEEMFPLVFGCCLPSLIAALLLFFGAGSNIKDMVKVKMAPRIYTIEWTAEQLSPKNRN